MTRFRKLGWLAAAGGSAALFASAAEAQILRGRTAPANPAPAVTAPAPVAPAPAVTAPVAPAPGETAGQTRREGRQEARDARAESRDLGATGPEARQAARDTRQGTRQNIQATRAADMGLWVNARNNGLVISDIAQNSAFSTAGFRAGDQLVSVNNQPITTEQQFVQYLNGPSLGTQPVQFVVLRNGQQQTLTLQPTALSQGIVNHDPLYQYGLVLNNQNPNQIVVQQVYPRTPAYYAGIRQGDVITTLGGQRIANVNAFTQGLAQANAAIPLQISRAGQMQSIQLDPIQANGQAFANDQINAGGPAAHTALRPNLDGANINPGVNAGVNANANVGANVPGVNANLNAGPAGVNANLNAAPAGANVNASTTAPAAGAAAAAGANDAIGAAPRSEPNSPVAAPPAANDRSSNSNDRPAPPANDRNADRGDNNGKRGGDRDAREPRPSGTVPATPATPASGSKSDRDGKSDAHPATPAQPGNGANSPSGSNSANSPR